MSNPIAEFFALIQLKGGKESISAMKGLLDVTVAAKTAMTQNLEVLYKWSEAARNAAMNLEIYQTNTGLSGEQLQEMSYKAAQAGVSIEELGSQIQKIQQMTKDIQLGQGDYKPFQLLQIDPNQDPISILDDLQDRLRSLYQYDPARAKQFANMFGLSDTMFYSLLDESNEQMNKHFLLTEKEQKALVKLNKEWNKIWFYIKQIGVKLQGMGAALQSSFVKVLLNAVQGAGEILTRLSDIINASEDFKNILLAVGAVLAYLFAPWLLQLAAIALILEDIFVYFQGGDSVTGMIVDWCKQSERFQEIWLGIKTVFDLLKMSLEGLQMLWTEVIEPIISKVDEFMGSKLGEFILEALSFTNPLAVLGKARKAYDDLVNPEQIAAPAVPAASSTVTQNNSVTFQSSGNIHEDQQTASDFISDAQDTLPVAVEG